MEEIFKARRTVWCVSLIVNFPLGYCAVLNIRGGIFDSYSNEIQVARSKAPSERTCIFHLGLAGSNHITKSPTKKVAQALVVIYL